MAAADTTAAETFLLAMTPRLRGLLRMFLSSPADADDVLQIACIQFLTKGPPPGPPAEAWMLKTARNLALNHLRGDRRRTAREQARPEPAPADDPAETVARRESCRRIEACLAGLPLELREPLYLHVVEERSLREIAAELGMGKSTVATRVEQGLALLNRCFHGGAHGRT